MYMYTALVIITLYFMSLNSIPTRRIPQAYCFLVSCLLYREPNTIISALESLHQLLLSATPTFIVWLTTSQSNAQVLHYQYLNLFSIPWCLGGCGLLGR